MRNRTTALVALISLAACHSPPPPPPPAPVALSDSANAALQWIQSHASPISAEDSVPTAQERAELAALTSGARVIGLSEMNEGTHEFYYLVRRMLIALADSGVRGLAVQGSMAEALEVDRYVRGGTGDVRRLLHNVGSWRYETREMTALVEAMRAWNMAHPDRAVGFYGFEIPTAAHAVATITALPDSVLGAPLKRYLVQRYSCVAMNEGAHWGLEGRAADSTFWSSCGPATTQAMDSIVALRQRRNTPQLAFAEQMARLVQHHVSVGLRRLPRQEGNAEHVMFVLNSLPANGRLMLWGGDVEMGRLTLDRTTVQTGVALGERLGSAYRAITYTFGDGSIRARVPSMNARSAEAPGFSNARVLPPAHDTFEEAAIRAAPGAYLLDMRSLPNDIAGSWLKGPRQMRFIVETYVPSAQQAMHTPIQFPSNYDAVVFVKHATPAR